MKILLTSLLVSILCFPGATSARFVSKKPIKTGAEQTEKWVPYLKGKRVAMLANQTTIIEKTHLVDSLKTLGINIVKVFGPEHGFRGDASAGTHLLTKWM